MELTSKNSAMKDALVTAGATATQSSHTQSPQPKTGDKKMSEAHNDIWRHFGTETGMESQLSEEIQEFTENCEKSIEDTALKIEVINDSSQLRAPIQLIINVTPEQTSVYAQIIEAGITEALGTNTKNINGRQVQFNLVPANLVNTDTRDVIINALNNKGYNNSKLITMVCIPADTDLKSKIVAHVVMAPARIALAASHRSWKASDYVNAPNSKIVAHYDFAPASTTVNIFGRPLATDFRIRTDLRLVTKETKENTTTGVNNPSLRIANVNGYIDAIYKKSKRSTFNQQSGVLFAPQNVAEPEYIPLVVINDINGLSGSARSEENLMTQVIGIATAANIAAEKNWTRPFYREPGAENTKASIGLVGLESNIFKDPNWVAKELEVAQHGQGSAEASTIGNIANAYFFNACFIALDIESAGVNEFIQKLFIAASNNDTAAISRINNEIDVFTGGVYAKEWAMADSPVRSGRALLHTAFYRDPITQEKRDMQSIDYFRALETFNGDGQAMYDLTVDSSRNDIVSLDARFKTINATAPLTQTGWKSRVIFKPEWIQALIVSLKKCKFEFVPENLDVRTSDQERGSLFNDVDLGVGVDTKDIFSNGLHNDFDTGNSGTLFVNDFDLL